MRERRRFKHWVLLFAAAALVHVLFLLWLKPSYFSFVGKGKQASTARSSTDGGVEPDAVLYVPVEIEATNEYQDHTIKLVEDTPREPSTPLPSPPSPPSPSEAGSGASGPPSDLGDIVGEASRTMPRASEDDPVKIPPRPLQITWPDTRDLKHCMGHQIDVLIQVDEDGRILRVEPDASDHPPDCVAAALESARRIVFAPGRINGRAAKMWTEIRIDFRSRK